VPGTPSQGTASTGCGAWAATPRGPRALVEEGLANGHYDALGSVWEQAFLGMPLAHCEGPGHLARLDRVIALGGRQLAEAPAHLRPMYEFNVEQPRRHRAVIATFGRYPHRNAVLGRTSTPEELAYLERGELPHRRFPPAMG
jgi:uncharacterized protein (DUF924 family)